MRRAVLTCFKSILTISLACASIVGTGPAAGAKTADGFNYAVSNGKATITGCAITCPQRLVLPSAIGGYSVGGVAYKAFFESQITSVTIPVSVTTIGTSAFENNQLSSLSLPSSVTTIGASAFAGNQLSILSLPSSVTTINSSAFARNQFTSLSLPSSVTTINSSAFAENPLTALTIPSSVTTIGDHAFYPAGNFYAVLKVKFLGNAPSAGYNVFGRLTSLARVEGTTGWENGFSGHDLDLFSGDFTYKLLSGDAEVTGCSGTCPIPLVIPSTLSDHSVIGIGRSAFRDSGIASVTIPSSVQTIGDEAFFAAGLTSVTIPSSVQTIGRMAFYVNGLTSVTIPSSVQTIGAEAFMYNSLELLVVEGASDIASGAFEGNPFLQTVKFLADAPTVGGQIFGDSRYLPPLLKFVGISAGTTGWNTSFSGIPTSLTDDGWYYSDDDGQIKIRGSVWPYPKSINIPSTFQGKPVTGISDEAFFIGSSGNDSAAITSKRLENQITSVTIPSSVITIGSSAFSSNLLTSIAIPSSVTTIGNFAFAQNKIVSVIIPSSVSSLGNYCFSSNKISSLNIPAYTTTIPEGTYSGNQIIELTIPESVTEIGVGAFRGNQITELTIPESVTEIGLGAFQNNKLTSLTIPSSLTTIAPQAFASNKIASLTLPSSVSTIGSSAFRWNSIANLTIPPSITEIGYAAFSENAITTLTIPSTVTTIEAYAFEENGLSSVVFEGSGIRLGYAAFIRNDLRLVKFLGGPPTRIPSQDSAKIFSNNPNLKKLAISEQSQGWPSQFEELPVYYANDDWFYHITSSEEAALGGCVWVCQPELTLPEQINGRSVTKVSYDAFSQNQLRSVSIPPTVTTIDNYAFDGNFLTNLTLPESVENVGYAAFSQNQLTNLNLPTSLQSISGEAFKGNQLTSITIPASVTSIDNDAFANNQLNFVKFLGGAPSSSGNSFRGNTNLFHLVNTEGSVGWEDKWAGLPVSQSSGTWYYLLDANDATLRGCVRPCSARLIIPSSVNGHEITAIGEQAFVGNNLESVTFPSTVTEIRYRAFWSNQLSTVTIPSSVLQIGSGAFMQNQLNSVEFMGNAPSAGEDVFRYNSLTKLLIYPLAEGWDDTWSGIPVSSSRTVTFNTLGGTPVDTYDFDPGDSIPDAFPDSSRKGYKFLGWSITIGGSAIKFPYSPLVTTDLTFYALWSKNPVRAAASTKPTVSGTPTVKKTLVANKGVWSGYPTPIIIAYQWYSCTFMVPNATITVPKTCKAISGATRSTFVLTKSQQGKYVSVRVTGKSSGTDATLWLTKSTKKIT